MVVQTSKGKFRIRDAQRGQELTVYIPSDHFVVNIGDEIAAADQTPIEDVVPVADAPAAIERAPVEASRVAEAPPPVVPQVVTPPAPQPSVVASSTPQPAKDNPWPPLILGVVIAVIVIGVFTMRHRSN